ncbi:MFS transporter [Streptomyces sp. NPDC001544]|uniref:MFS transporter n=1 Tax=Streptomyces sp. NPDC001544 TaxID=3364584 RepID=UPI00369AC765
MKKRYTGVSPGVYLTGAAAARTGDEMSGPALLLAALTAAGPAAEASSLLAAVTAAAAVGGPVFGMVLDRSARPGRLLAVALALHAAGLLLVLSALGRLPYALVLVIAVGTGLSGPALSGGWTAQLPRVAPPEGVARATALDAMTFGAASLIGPALAGTTAELLGATAAVLLSATLIAAALPVAWTLPARRPVAGRGPYRGTAVEGVPPRSGAVGQVPHRNVGADGDPQRYAAADGYPNRYAAADGDPNRYAAADGDPHRNTAVDGAQHQSTVARRAPHESTTADDDPHQNTAARRAPHGSAVLGDLAAGVRCIGRSPSLAGATVTSVASCAAQGVLITCTPLLGARFVGGAGRGALLLSGIAVASLAASAVLARSPGRRLTPDAVVRIGALLQAAALALAATGRPALLAATVVLAGAGEGPQLTALFAVRHREAPERLRGQVFTTGASLKIAGFALGAAVAGPMADWSLHGALLTAAGLHVAGALFASAGHPTRKKHPNKQGALDR